MKQALAIAVVGLALTGCASPPSVWELKYGPDKPQFSYVRQSDGTKTGDLYVWNPNTTAAYINASGNACIQSANVFRVNSGSTAGKLGADTLGQGVAGLDVGYAAQSAQAAMLLASQDAKGTFLSLAMFNLCMLAANGSLKPEQLPALIEKAITSAATMPAPSFAPVSVVNTNGGTASVSSGK